MIEALKNEDIVTKVGGRFRLTALIQRRLKELIEGSRPLVEAKGLTMVEIAIREIDQDKIAIDYEKSIGIHVPDGMAQDQEIHGTDMEGALD